MVQIEGHAFGAAGAAVRDMQEVEARERGAMRESRVTMRLIGLPTDSHSSFLRGAAAAPAAIRAALASEHANQASESGLDLGTDILVEDTGDLPLNESGGDIERIRAAAAEAAGDEVVPIFL